MLLSLHRLPRTLAVFPLALVFAACSSTPKAIQGEPLGEIRTGLTPTRSTADNMVRLDAQLRSSCASVNNIDRPDEELSATPQLWTAHTCHGDLVYNVTATPSDNGPLVEVKAAGGGVDAPANPHFTPALPEGAAASPDLTAPAPQDAASGVDATPAK
jgi:hypothetical protein